MPSLPQILSPEETTALLLSLKVSFVAVICSLPLGIWVSMLLARSRLPGLWLLNALAHLPLILPPVVTGYVLLLTFGRKGWIGQYLYDWFGFTFAFQWTGAALAAGVMSFPLMVRTIRLSIEAVDPKLEQAAATLGASRMAVFFTVTLPLILPGVIAGMIVAFAKAMGEFGATITFVSNIPGRTQTLPSAIYSFLQTPGADMQAARLAGVSVAVAVAALVASEFIARRVARRIGARG